MKKGNQIIKFSKEHYFLSNMYPCHVEYDGITYGCAEAAFQAQKATTENEKKQFSLLTGKQAKKLGGKNGPYRMEPGSEKLREWNQSSASVMEEVVRAKFTQNKDLAELLIATNDDRLIEGNNHFDNNYGIPLAIKEGTRKTLKTDENGCYILALEETPFNNKLGKILMKIRSEIRSKTQ